jgi:hypothetical protein
VKRWLLAAALLLPALYLAVYLRYRLPDASLLDGPAADQALAFLEAAVEGRPAPPLQAAALGRRPAGPVWVSLYRRGELLLRHQAQEADVAACLRRAAGAIRARRADLGGRSGLRIKLDLTIAEGPIFTWVPILFSHSIVPGLDGIGLQAGEKRAHLLPDELFARDLLSGGRPFSFMAEFRSGLALEPAIGMLADRLELTAEAWRAARRRFFRFRVQSFVDKPGGSGKALPVLRSRVPVYRIDRASVRQAVLRAADYVLRLIRADGSFEYIYYPIEDTYSPPEDYSLPRHAGTTWFLSLAYRVTNEPRYLEGARRAIDYLGARAVPPECQSTPYACIGNANEGDLGSAALGIVAIAEYQQATGDKRFERLARRLGDFLLWMQKPNGDFCHLYRPSTREKNCKEELLYYSGEAALGLAKLYQLTRDARLREPIERALDFLTVENYDFFLGQFFIGEDHWTCIAAEAAFEVVNKDQYAKFCYAFARLNARAQVQPGEGLLDDLFGVFTITPFFTPHNTPAGSRTESNVATYLLSVRRGEPQADILRTVRLTLRYLVDQQLRPEGDYLFRRPEAAHGGMMQTPLRPNIRIDFVQHAAAAMARGLELVPETPWP